MRSAFTYISLVVYFCLATMLLAVTSGFIYRQVKILNGISLRSSNLAEVNRLVDVIVEHIRYDDAVWLAEGLLYVRQGTQQLEFGLRNNRLYRKKDGYFYLSSESLRLTNLRFSQEGGLFFIAATAYPDLVVERIVRRAP